MGAGIARTIKANFPAAFEVDQTTKKGSIAKLGYFSYAAITVNRNNLIIVNAYTQYNYFGKGIKADYGAIRSVFAQLKQQFKGKRFGFPLIGAGLARGDWNIISKIIEEELDGEDFTLVVL
jgi:O-acetyl-ADP-ribose deacetylase (regulator of RNase III)